VHYPPIRKLPSRKRTSLDNLDSNVIFHTAKDFCINQKMVPSINKILALIKDKIDFPWQKDIHRNTVMDMGFVWKCSVSKRKVPVERGGGL
jgi:hypothetical protein